MAEKDRDTLQETWRPMPEQELLVRAATGEGEAARAAWEAWIATANVERLDPGSTRIVPLLYRNLQAAGVDHPLMTRFGLQYRHTWLTNQLTLRHMSDVIAEFGRRGIQTMVLKGAAMMTRYYKDFGVRPMADCDVLVPTGKADEAIAVLAELGWQGDKPLHLLTSEYRTPLHGMGFFHPDKRSGFDLHWHVMHMNLAERYNVPMWEAAVPLKVGAVDTLALCAEHQLVHLFYNGCINEGTLNLRWLPDALVLLKQEPTLDWQRLVAHCQRLEFVTPVAKILRYLQASWALAVPAEVLAALDATPENYRMRQVYAALNKRKDERSGMETFWILYSQFLMSQEKVTRFAPLGFVQFLRYRWNLNDLKGTLRYAMQRTRGVDADTAKELAQ